MIDEKVMVCIEKECPYYMEPENCGGCREPLKKITRDRLEVIE